MSNPWTIALLVIACEALVFAISFLMAAILTFACYDQRPLDRETDRMLTSATWLGGGMFICFLGFLAVTRYWRQCQLGRRLFHVGLACGCLAVLCGWFAAHGS